MATRLWQNTAKVHFNTEACDDGCRLIYGGHVISPARAPPFNGLANGSFDVHQRGAHTAPAFAGDTVYVVRGARPGRYLRPGSRASKCVSSPPVAAMRP